MKLKLIAGCIAFACFVATTALAIATPVMLAETHAAQTAGSPLRTAADRKRVLDERRERFAARRQ
jgi:hypothetical protein